MKRIFILALVALLGITAKAQEIGLTSVRVENPKFANSQYIDFVKNASQMTKLESVFSGILKFPMGGFVVSVEKTTDMTTNQSKKAIVISPNGGAMGAMKGLMGKGAEPSIYFIDENEIDGLIAAVKKMQDFQKTPPTVNTYLTYVARGGFSVTTGFNALGKIPVWTAKVADGGSFPVVGKEFDFFTMMIETLENAKKNLATLK